MGLTGTLLLHTLFADELEALFAPLVLQRESMNQSIYVVRQDGMTVLKSGGLFINNNVYNPERPLKHYLEYTALLCMAAVYCDSPESILVIGLAGGTVPTYLAYHYPQAEITSVDFDPAMLDVAVEYFNFRETKRLRAVIQDGRVFLRQSQKKYDLILVDAFDGRNVPFHMATVEFLELCKSRLTAGGVFAANTPGAPGVNEHYLATFLQVFPRVDVFQAQRAGNRILVALQGEAPMDEPGLYRLFSARQRDIQFAEMDVARLFNQTFFEVYRKDGKGGAAASEAAPFTDDHAPVNLLLPPAQLSL